MFIVIREIGAGAFIWSSGPLDLQILMDPNPESAGRQKNKIGCSNNQ